MITLKKQFSFYLIFNHKNDAGNVLDGLIKKNADQ